MQIARNPKAPCNHWGSVDLNGSETARNRLAGTEMAGSPGQPAMAGCSHDLAQHVSLAHRDLFLLCDDAGDRFAERRVPRCSRSLAGVHATVVSRHDVAAG